jgi:HEAT repeat protein
MFWTSWKGLAVVGLLAVSLIGAGVGAYASGMLTAREPNGGPAIARDDDPANPEELKQEVARLQTELQKLQEEIGRLRAKLDAPSNRAKPVLFRGKPAAYWIEALEDRDPAYRTDAVKAIGGIAEVDRSVIPILIASLKDRSGRVGGEAADSLGDLGVVALPPLLEVMKNGTAEVRLRAMQALSRIGLEAVPALANALRDPDNQVASTAVQYLLRLARKDETATKAIQAAATGKDEQLRRRTIRDTYEVMDHWGDVDHGAGVAVFVEGLNDPDMEIRRSALTGLTRFSPVLLPSGKPAHPSVVPALLKLLKDPKIEKSLRRDAYGLLSRMDPVAAQEAVGLGNQ